MLGLKRGTVELFPHQIAWEQEAADTIAQLRCWMGPLLLDARHVGSTAIRSIAAKPIIDIAVGIEDFDALHRMVPALEEKGIVYRPVDDRPDHRLFVKGDFAQDTRTHHIHVVRYGSSICCFVVISTRIHSRPRNMKRSNTDYARSLHRTATPIRRESRR